MDNTSLIIFTGVMVFTLGQISLELIIKPVKDLKIVIAEIALYIVEYANIYSTPDRNEGSDKAQMASEKFRTLSSELLSKTHLIIWYKPVAWIFRLPSMGNIRKASGYLIGLSNGFSGLLPKQGMLNMYKAQHICDELKIFVDEGGRLDYKDEKNFL